MAKTLLEVLSEEGIETFETSNGRSVAHCPFHKGDREPSFTIYPDEKYYCFGCSRWGDAVKFLVEFKGITSKEALEIVGIDYVLPKAEKKAIKIRNLAKTSRFLYDVSLKYHNYLREIPGPQVYLQDRGLEWETIDRFKLGYTDGAVLDYRSVEEYELANEIGLLNKNGGEILSHRITIPNIIENQYADFMIGRTVINDRLKYLGLRMPKPICGFYDSRNSPILFLVEGNFDYLILRQWGYPAIVMSGSHISGMNLALLKGRVVVVVPDNDEVGLKAAAAIKAKLPSTIIIDYRHLEVKDIGELALKNNAKKNFDAVVQEALWDTNSLNLYPTWMKYLPTSIDLTLSATT